MTTEIAKQLRRERKAEQLAERKERLAELSDRDEAVYPEGSGPSGQGVRTATLKAEDYSTLMTVSEDSLQDVSGPFVGPAAPMKIPFMAQGSEAATFEEGTGPEPRSSRRSQK